MFIKNKTASIIFKIFIVLSGIIGILLQCGAFDNNFSLKSFKMFTTLSNAAVIIYFAVSVIWLIANKGKYTFAPSLKFAITIGIILTGLVAHFMLRKMFANMEGNMKAALFILHYVVPIATVLDWLLFDEKGSVKKYFPWVGTIMPLVYYTVSMVVVAGFGGNFSVGGVGENHSRFPYPFMDVDLLGSSKVAMITLVLAVGVIAVGFILYAIDSAMSKKAKKKSEVQEIEK